MADNATWPGWLGPADYEPQCPETQPPLIDGMFSATSGPVARRIAEWRAREANK
jgi:hypothetical protein